MGNQLVEVYYNLHKHVFSIRDRKTKIVIDHQESVLLKDCRFFVSEKGRQRVLRESRKNVHAWIIGELIHKTNEPFVINGEGYYNPYTCESFIDLHSKEKLEQAKSVFLHQKKIYYTKGES